MKEASLIKCWKCLNSIHINESFFCVDRCQAEDENNFGFVEHSGMFCKKCMEEFFSSVPIMQKCNQKA